MGKNKPIKGLGGFDPSDIQKLKDYWKTQSDIRWRTLQNALDMGKSPKELLDDLKGKTGKIGLVKNRLTGEVDFRGEHEYAENLQKEFKKWNKNRRALKIDINTAKEISQPKSKPANKIVSTNRLNLKSSQTMWNAISEGVPKKDREEARKRLIKKSKKVRMEKGFWKTPQGKISKSARNAQKLQMKQLLKLALDSPEYKRITSKLKPISLEEQFKQFQSLDDSIKFQKGEYRGKHFSESQKMAKAYYDNLYKFHKTNETRNLQLQIKDRNRLRYEINKKLKAGVDAPKIPKSSALKVGLTSKLSGLGSGIGTLGAGRVLNALSDKYLMPLAEKAGTKLGESLIPVGRKIDQLLIRKKKKDD